MNIVKKLISLGLLIAALLPFRHALALAGTKQTDDRSEKGAAIVIDGTAHDFGRVLIGETVSATFPFRNGGDKVLKLYPVPDERSHLQVRISDKSLEPGGYGQIEVTLETSQLYGSIADSISVFTNDREHREIFLKMTGRALPIVAAAAPVYQVGNIAKEGGFSGSIPLVGVLVEEGDLSGVTLEPSSPHIRAKISGNGAGDNTQPVLEFTLLPELKAGNIEETIAIVSSDPPAKAYLRLFGKKRGDIRVTPERLTMVRREGEDDSEHVLVIESDRSFRIIQVEDLTRHLDLSTRTIIPGSKYELVARLKDPHDGHALGAVRLYTDLEAEPMLEIPVIVGVISDELREDHGH